MKNNAAFLKGNVLILVLYVILVVVAVISLILVSMIPSSVQKQQVGTSISLLEREGVYPSYGFPFRQVVLDNFTDTLMLNTAYSSDSTNPVRAAFVNNRGYNPENSADQIGPLKSLYQGDSVAITGYERYWHGYLVWLRPTLTIVSYAEIRLLLTGLLYGTGAVFLYLAWKKIGKRAAIAFAVSLLFVDFLYLGQSMQFSAVFLIGLLAGILVLKTEPKNLASVFFCVGALTSFFDLLTAPLVPLGIVLAVALSLKTRNVKTIIAYSAVWAVGYGSMWGAKWILAEYFFAPGAILNALQQISTRTITQADETFSHISAIKLNIAQLIGYHPISKGVVLLSTVLAGGIILAFHRVDQSTLKKVVPWVVVAVIPYLWYLVAANHSYLHVWYTYRAQLITVFAGVMIYFELLNVDAFRAFLKSLKTRIKSAGR